MILLSQAIEADLRSSSSSSLPVTLYIEPSRVYPVHDTFLCLAMFDFVIHAPYMSHCLYSLVRIIVVSLFLFIGAFRQLVFLCLAMFDTDTLFPQSEHTHLGAPPQAFVWFV